MRGHLAVGPSPQRRDHANHLRQQGIVAVLRIYEQQDLQPSADLQQPFGCWKDLHIEPTSPTRQLALQLSQGLRWLNELLPKGPLYVSCSAGRDRSPLLCMAWLMHRRGMTLIQAMDYLMRVHWPSRPWPDHLKALPETNPGLQRAPQPRVDSSRHQEHQVLPFRKQERSRFHQHLEEVEAVSQQLDRLLSRHAISA